MGSLKGTLPEGVSLAGKAVGLQPEERIRRFWRAHVRSFRHLTVLHAFCDNPRLAWTPERLSSWYGLRVDRTRAITRELAACRILLPVEGELEAYRWNPALAWVDPASPATQEVLRMARTLRKVASARAESRGS